MTDPCLLPSACHDGIGTTDCIAFAAPYLAYTPPYQRFAHCLTAVTRARLGVSVDRYSFTVTDFHHLPLADLPGAPWLNPTPHAIAVYASHPLSPVAMQHSLPSGRYSLLG